MMSPEPNLKLKVDSERAGENETKLQPLFEL